MTDYKKSELNTHSEVSFAYALYIDGKFCRS